MKLFACYKKIIFLLFAILSGFNSFSQNRNEDFLNGTKFLDKDMYDSALAHFNSSLLSYNSDTLNKDYFSLLYSIGENYFQQKKYDSALKYYESGLKINKIIFSQVTEDRVLNRVGTMYYRQNKYSKAINYFLEDLPIIVEKFGEASNKYATATSNIANCYYNLRLFDKAEEYFLITLKKKEILYGRVSNDYSSTLAWLSTLFLETRSYYNALSYCKEAIEIREKISGKENAYYWTNVYKLAKVYEGLKKMDSAEYFYNQIYNQVISRNKNKDSLYRVIYVPCLFKLAKIYLEKEDFQKEKSLLSLLEQEINTGTSQSDYLDYLTYQVIFNIKIFQYSKAWDYNEKLIDIHLIDSISSCYLANDFNTNGEILRRIGEENKAKDWYFKAWGLMKKCGDTTSTKYAGLLNNLSLLFVKSDTSTYFLKKSYEVFQKRKENNPILFSNSILINLAINSFYYEKDTLLAFSLLDSLWQYKMYLTPANIERMFVLSSELYYSIGLDSIAANSMRVYFLRKRKNIIEWCKLSNSSFESFYNNDLLNVDDRINLLLYKLIQEDPVSVAKYRLFYHYYNLIALKKSLLLRRNISAKKYFENSNDSSLQKAYKEFISKKQGLTILYNKNNVDNDLIEILDNEIDSIENFLLINSDFYSELSKSLKLNYDSILLSLKNDVAIIDFYEINNSQYAIFFKSGYNAPKFIYLFEQKHLESLIQKHQNSSDSLFFNKLYQYGDNGKNLQELIWKPMDSLLEGVKTIYVVPSGLLHTINLSALPLNNSIRVGDRYNLRFVGSTGEIVSLKEQYISDSTVNKAWLFGGIDYNNISFTQPKFSPGNEFNYSLSSKQTTRSGTKKWNYLLNTLYEASSIDTLCRNNNITTSFINGKLASKTVFKNISGETKSYILHLATHGYFSPDIKSQSEDSTYTPLNSKQNIFKWSDNPLLRSGLIFSGANKTWSNENYQSDSTDDGILTALEVSNLDLSEAKLVVMSACETGLGDIKGSEGVFGLQRAFKLAGAKNIIMSLWKVPDAQTKELMKLFYQNCFNGLSVFDALKAAQTVMSKKYPPYYWAAFKLLE